MSVKAWVTIAICQGIAAICFLLVSIKGCSQRYKIEVVKVEKAE